MEDIGCGSFVVETLVEGETQLHEYSISLQNTVKFVKARLRDAFCVRGGDISSRGDRMVVVNKFVADKIYFFMGFREEVRTRESGSPEAGSQALDQKFDQVLEMMNSLVPMVPLVNSLIPMVCELTIKQNNLWTPSVVSGARNNKCRPALMKKFGYKNKWKLPKCMVTGLVGGGSKIICGHLVPSAGRQDKLKELNIKVTDLNCPENCVFWCAGIERMYESLQLSFLKSNPLRDAYFLKCWTDAAKNEPLWPGDCRTVGEYDGCELVLGTHKIWKRALSYQAYQAFLVSDHSGDTDLRNQALYGSPMGPSTADYPFAQKARMMRNEFLKTRAEETEEDV